MTYLLLILLPVVATVAYIALRNAQDFSDANEIVPGIPTNAPKAWAGAHSPEARLHRRLRDAVLAMQANASLDDPAMAPVRTSIEEQALAVDERLIAVAALPKAHREGPIGQVENAVVTIEEAVASVVDLRGPSMTSIEDGLAEVETRMRSVEEARAELESLSPSSTTFDTIRDHIESTSTIEEPPSPDGDADAGR